MKLTKRLQAITEFLSAEDNFIDIGTDHAYIPIVMYQKGTKKILATDIHEDAVRIARQNIQDLNIEVIKTDGIKGVDTKDYNTLILAGMGYHTIAHILKTIERDPHISKIIIQSNNHLKDVRLYLMHKNFALVEEKIIEENNHDYVIMKFLKGTKKLTEQELLFGLYKEENKWYYQKLHQKITSLLPKVPLEKQQNLKKEKELLETYL